MSFNADCTTYATRKQVTFLQQPTKKKIAILIVASTNTAVKPLIDPEGNI